uniref:ShTK domain protein n=1 Tax=Syphacia muris TaxID=451379 RepID=A0A0N5AI20_9BILA
MIFPEVCADKTAPGRPSDCPRLSYLCNDPIYYNVMTSQCPKTCNRCPGSSLPTTTVTDCIDLAAPGRPSDCRNLQYLCNSPLYSDLMRKQCRKTCGFC